MGRVMTQEEYWSMERADIRANKIRDCFIDAIFTGISLIMPLTKRNDGLLCHTPIITWLFVQSGIYCLSLLRNLLVLCAIHMDDSQSPKDAKFKIEAYYLCLVLNF